MPLIGWNRAPEIHGNEAPSRQRIALQIRLKENPSTKLLNTPIFLLNSLTSVLYTICLTTHHFNFFLIFLVPAFGTQKVCLGVSK